jgi:hypothetical protein
LRVRSEWKKSKKKPKRIYQFPITRRKLSIGVEFLWFPTEKMK